MYIARLNEQRFIVQYWPGTFVDYQDRFATDSNYAFIQATAFKSSGMRRSFMKDATRFKVNPNGSLFERVR